MSVNICVCVSVRKTDRHTDNVKFFVVLYVYRSANIYVSKRKIVTTFHLIFNPKPWCNTAL